MGLIAGIASFFVAGLGQAVKGEVVKGIKIFVLMVVLGASSAGVAFTPLAPLAVILQGGAAILWFLQLLDAGGLFELPLL